MPWRNKCKPYTIHKQVRLQQHTVSWGQFSRLLAELPLGLGKVCVLIPSDNSGCITTLSAAAQTLASANNTQPLRYLAQSHHLKQAITTDAPSGCTHTSRGVHNLVNTQDVWTRLDTATCAVTSCVITAHSESPWPLISTDVYQWIYVCVCVMV